jgi:serine/threonine-protein kinase RsbW
MSSQAAHGGPCARLRLVYEPTLIEPLTTHVTIEVPARAQYVKVLRSILASVAAGLDFSLERIDDLKMAVGEASSQLLDAAPDGLTLKVEADPVPEGLRVDVALDSSGLLWPPPDIESTLTWRVLSTVAADIDFGRSDEGIFVRLLVTTAPPEHRQ